MCAAPFGGPAARLMRWRGRAPWPNNPDYCGACFQLLDRYHGGAEIDSSFLFADIRGSTTLAEGISPTAFRTLLDRFYDVAVAALVAHDGIVDKFVGDEVVGIFIPRSPTTSTLRVRSLRHAPCSTQRATAVPVSPGYQ